MKTLRTIAFFLGASGLLAGCGGDGARPEPVAAPPAQVVAASFPLPTSTAFDATTAVTTYQTQPVTNRVTLGTINVGARGGGITVDYDSTNGIYTVRDAAASASFGAADRTASTGFIDTYAKQSGTIADQLQLFGNVRAGGPQSNAPVQLTYLSYGMWSHTDSQTGETRKTYLLFGFPTASADMPRSGSASYATAVTGSMLEFGGGGESQVAGTASFNVDFGTGGIKTDLTLTSGNGLSALGTYNGTGTLTGNQFAGTFTSSAPFYVGGSFTGGFFGPAAQEMGYTFAIRKHNPDPFAGASVLPMDTSIIGTVVGTKR